MSVSSLFLRSESLAKLAVLSLLFVGAVAQASPSATLPAYFGCVEDIPTRILYDFHTAYDNMTVESCASDCSGYTYFGTEYGRECRS